jgi:hypothetical protein
MAASQTIQMLGLLGALSYALTRLVAHSRMVRYSRYAIVAQPRESMPAMPRGYRVEELSGEALAGHRIDASPAVQAARFAEGLTCLGAFDRHDRLTGLVWLRCATYNEDEVRVRFLLPEHCCWDTGLWIRPEHRQGRTFAALWAGVAEWMAARSLTHSLSRVSDYNLAALRAHRRMGAAILTHCSFLRLGDWQWCRQTGPRLVRLGRPEPPQYDLRDLAPG